MTLRRKLEPQRVKVTGTCIYQITVTTFYAFHAKIFTPLKTMQVISGMEHIETW